MSERLKRVIEDRLVDEVARQLTEGQPLADFRARLVARLDAGDRPRRFWPAAWALAPVAVAAIVVAVFVARPFKGHDLAPVSADRTVQPKPDSTTVRLPPSPQGSFGETGKPPFDGAQGGPERVEGPDTTYDSGWTPPRIAKNPVGRRTYRPGRAAAEIDALAPPPLDVPTLDLTSLSAEPIAVAPMDSIAPIPVTPLSTNDERPWKEHRP